MDFFLGIMIFKNHSIISGTGQGYYKTRYFFQDSSYNLVWKERFGNCISFLWIKKIDAWILRFGIKQKYQLTYKANRK